MAYIPGRKARRIRQEEAQEKKKEKQIRPDLDIEKLKASYDQLEVIHREVRESQIEMILNLAIAAEYKDPDTGNHILRISDYVTELAKAIDLSKEEIEILRYASPMHDIGKIGIPDSILQKPGKLTPEEWVIMKQHPIIGYRMFKNSQSELLRAISTISISHHEKYDGSGYPYGLKGKDIPLYGRMIALVDVFDAVVNKRCYKEAWSFEEGFKYIRSLAGTHLDPDLVDAFARIELTIRQVYDANRSIQQYMDQAVEENLGEAENAK
jgi:putative two-component system response regulator